MIREITYNNRWFYGSCIFLLASIILFVYSGSFIFLASPFVLYYIIQIWQNWKLAYMLLLFCIPASIQIVLLNHSLSISLPDEPMEWLFLLLFILLLASQPSIIPKWWWRNPIVIIVTLQFLWLIVAVVFSKVPFFSIKFLIAKTWYLACFFIFPLLIFKDKKDFKAGFIISLIPMLATIVIIIFRQSLYDFRFSNIQDAIGILYYNHVEYSTVISMFLPLLWVAYPLIEKQRKWLRTVLVTIIIFFITAIFFSYARAAMMAVIFSLIVGMAIKRKWVNMIIPAFYGLILLALVYLIGFNNYSELKPKYDKTNMRTSFSAHIIATFKKQDMSSMERLYRWIAAVRMSNDRPITGYGPHAFYNYYKPYALSSFKTYASNNPERSTTHNYFLLMLAEQGWPAMLLYAVLVVVVFAQAQKTYHRFSDRFYKNCTLGLAMAFAACFVNNFFSELIETHKVGSMFYLVIALLVILDHKSKEIEGKEEIA